MPCDKTNEANWLKQHLEEFFAMFPCLQVLTGDAADTPRSLLKAIQECHQDYLVQVRDNQPKVFQDIILRHRER